MNYSKGIRTVRASKGLTQKQLSKLANIDRSYLSRIESGERVPTAEVLEAISKSLSIPLYLLTLISSEEEDLKGLPVDKTNQIANQLLKVLVSSQLESRNVT